LKLKIDLSNVFETGKPPLKKPVIINLHLVVFVQSDPGELRGIKVESWTFAEFRSSL
jgi:hypothetical protein